MDIAYFWQELSKSYSSNQVFLILIYWTLIVYKQVASPRSGVGKVEDWSVELLKHLAEVANNTVRDAADGLSQRIEWSTLEKDEKAIALLEEYAEVLASYFGWSPYLMLVEELPDDKEERLLNVMEKIFHMAALSTSYVTTPDSIRTVVKELLAQNNIHNILDMCSGSGGLGMSVWLQLQDRQQVGYYGMDTEPVMCDICTLMAHMCGISKGAVTQQDILRNETFYEEKKYDLVLLDVPIGQNRNVQGHIYARLLEDMWQNTIFVDWVYLLKAVKALNDEGKCISIVTSGTLTRQNEAGLRERMIQNDWIEAVITLPVNLYPNTRIGSEMIIFNKRKEVKRSQKILFIDISSFFYRDNRNFYAISEEGIRLAADIFHEYYEEKDVSRILDIAKLDQDVWSLKPLRYIGQQEEKGEKTATLCLKDIAQIARGVQLRKEEEEELCRYGNAFYLNIKDIQDGRIHYEEAKRITPKNSDWHRKFQIEENDILITSKGVSFKVAIVEENPPETYISGNLTILRVDEKKYHPYVLLEYLTSPEGMQQLESIQSGSTIRVLNNSNLEKLRIPKYPEEVMNNVGDQLKGKRNRYEQERKRLEETYISERKRLLIQIGIEA